MSISERAVAHLKTAETPEHERSLSEQYRLVAKAWVDIDGAARMLEELKTTKLEQAKQALILAEGDMPDSHAERRVKAGPDWEQYIRDMVQARTDANLKRVHMEYLKMKEREQQSAEANARHEARLSR